MSYNFHKRGLGAEDRPFNFAQLFLERTDMLFQKGNEARVEGDSFLWYRVLATILTAISFKLDDENETKKLERKLNVIRGKIKTANKTNSEELFFYEIEKELNDVEKEIIALMYKYELYYPKYSSQSWEKEFEEEDT